MQTSSGDEETRRQRARCEWIGPHGREGKKYAVIPPRLGGTLARMTHGEGRRGITLIQSRSPRGLDWAELDVLCQILGRVRHSVAMLACLRRSLARGAVLPSRAWGLAPGADATVLPTGARGGPRIGRELSPMFTKSSFPAGVISRLFHSAGDKMRAKPPLHPAEGRCHGIHSDHRLP